MSISKVKRYAFSGHESFPCKTLWLKKGYDFVVDKNDFNSPEAVIGLGVGKNMVSSIRFWLQAWRNPSSDLMLKSQRSGTTASSALLPSMYCLFCWHYRY
jgi:hypothetical protein